MSGNFIADGYDYAIYVMNRTNIDLSDVHINSNAIYNNALGSHNELTGVPIDLSGNWWGSANGPTTALNTVCGRQG